LQRGSVHTNFGRKTCKEESSWKRYVCIAGVNNCTSLSCRTLGCRLRLKYDGALAETRFRLSAKRTSPFKSAGVSVQSTTGSRGVRISSSNAGHTMFRGSVKSTGYALNFPGSPSLPLPCVPACHHISTGPHRRLEPCINEIKQFCVFGWLISAHVSVIV
jgi:hypothetical protein